MDTFLIVFWTAVIIGIVVFGLTLMGVARLCNKSIPFMRCVGILMISLLTGLFCSEVINAMISNAYIGYAIGAATLFTAFGITLVWIGKTDIGVQMVSIIAIFTLACAVLATLTLGTLYLVYN